MPQFPGYDSLTGGAPPGTVRNSGANYPTPNAQRSSKGQLAGPPTTGPGSMPPGYPSPFPGGPTYPGGPNPYPNPVPPDMSQPPVMPGQPYDPSQPHVPEWDIQPGTGRPPVGWHNPFPGYGDTIYPGNPGPVDPGSNVDFGTARPGDPGDYITRDMGQYFGSSPGNTIPPGSRPSIGDGLSQLPRSQFLLRMLERRRQRQAAMDAARR